MQLRRWNRPQRQAKHRPPTTPYRPPPPEAEYHSGPPTTRRPQNTKVDASSEPPGRPYSWPCEVPHQLALHPPPRHNRQIEYRMISENSKNPPPPGVTTATAPPQQPIRRSCYSNSPYPDATLVRLCYRQPRPPPAKPGLRLRLHGLPTLLHHRPPHTRPGLRRTRTFHNHHCSIPCPHHAAGTPCSLSTAGSI